MQGPFSMKYFLKGAGAEDWFKSWGLGWRLIVTIIIIIFIIIAIHKIFFEKQTQMQTQKLNVWPLSFSTVTYAPQQEQKQEIKKRPWWLPIVFVEGYGFTETTGDDSRTGVGGKGGLRFEW